MTRHRPTPPWDGDRWSATCSIHRFPGDHEGILEDRGARDLAQALRSVLDERVRDD